MRVWQVPSTPPHQHHHRSMLENPVQNINRRWEMRTAASTPVLSRRLAGWALVLLCVTLYLPAAALTPFFTKGEPREALVVRQMVEEGDWILPKRPSASGWTIASKPPLFHWLGALVSRAAGRTSELSVRSASLVLGTAAVLLLWVGGRALLSPHAAVAGAVVLATSFEWVRAASAARVDATLAALMTAALLIFYKGFVRDGLARLEALAAYLYVAGAALTKGPVGLVLPLLVLGTALLAQRKIRLLPRFRPLLGAFVILATVGVWYAGAWSLGGDAFFQKHVLRENLFRFLTASKLESGHEHPFYYYLPTLSAGFLPWTPAVAAALWAALRSPKARREPRIAFLLVWFGTVLLFYSLASSKRSVYLLPLYPAGALLVGWWWDGIATSGRVPRWLSSRFALGIAAAVGVAVFVVLLASLTESLGLSHLAGLAPLLSPTDRANLPIVLELVDVHLATVATGLTCLLATLATLFWALSRNRWKVIAAASTALAAVLWILVFSVFQPALGERRTFAPFVRAAAHRAGGHPLYFYPGTFDFGAAFYAPPGTRHWQTDRGHGPGPHYVLVWDEALAELSADEHARFDVLATSETTAPEGTRRLSLARIR